LKTAAALSGMSNSSLQVVVWHSSTPLPVEERKSTPEAVIVSYIRGRHCPRAHVLTSYAPHKNLLTNTVDGLSAANCDTVDTLQGHEKDEIIWSLGRHTNPGNIGKTSTLGHNKDRRRVNVALTRAIKKLIIVVHESFVDGSSPCEGALFWQTMFQTWSGLGVTCSVDVQTNWRVTIDTHFRAEHRFSAQDVRRLLHPHDRYFNKYQIKKVGALQLVLSSFSSAASAGNSGQRQIDIPENERWADMQDEGADEDIGGYCHESTEDHNDEVSGETGMEMHIPDHVKYEQFTLTHHFCFVEIMNVKKLWWAWTVGIEKAQRQAIMADGEHGFATVERHCADMLADLLFRCCQKFHRCPQHVWQRRLEYPQSLRTSLYNLGHRKEDMRSFIKTLFAARSFSPMFNSNAPVRRAAVRLKLKKLRWKLVLPLELVQALLEASEEIRPLAENLKYHNYGYTYFLDLPCPNSDRWNSYLAYKEHAKEPGDSTSSEDKAAHMETESRLSDALRVVPFGRTRTEGMVGDVTDFALDMKEVSYALLE